MSSDAFFGFLGVLVGALISGGFSAWLDRQRRERQLIVAAARCRDRLEKIQTLRSDPTTRDKEIGLLGPDMDCYLAAIGAASRARFRLHYARYEQLRPILIHKNLDGLAGAIEELRKVLPK